MDDTPFMVARLDEAEPVKFGLTATYQRLVAGGDAPVVTGIQTCQPGYATPIHRHPYVEVLFVVEGECHVWQDGAHASKVHLKAGDMVAVRPEIWHAFANPGTAPLRMLGIHCSPTRVVTYANGAQTQGSGYASYGADGAPLVPQQTAKPAGQ